MSLPQVAQGAKRKILDYKAIFTLPLRGVNAFSARYTKQYAYVASTARSIDFPSATLQRKFENRWQTRPDPLWWSVITRKSFADKRVLRSWAARRVRQAFVESLRKEGYAQDGSRIGRQGVPLIGTAQLFPVGTIMKTNFKDLVSQTDLLVQAIIKGQNKPITQGYRRHIGNAKEPFWKRSPEGVKLPPKKPPPGPASRSVKL
jgi:hypothetical protein